MLSGFLEKQYLNWVYFGSTQQAFHVSPNNEPNGIHHKWHNMGYYLLCSGNFPHAPQLLGLFGGVGEIEMLAVWISPVKNPREYDDNAMDTYDIGGCSFLIGSAYL
jgi:hypothetical protein